MSVDVNIFIAAAIVGTKKRKYVSYITSATITKYLQIADKATHGITLAKALSRSPTHSVRVKTFVLMDAIDEEARHIKKWLRWRSSTFMDYLHSVTRLASNHNNVINNDIAASST